MKMKKKKQDNRLSLKKIISISAVTAVLCTSTLTPASITTETSTAKTLSTKEITATENPVTTKEPITTKKPASTKKPTSAKKPTNTKKPTAAKKKKSNITKITISAAGDCTLGSDYKSPSSVNFYAKYNEKKNASYFFKNVKKIFKNDDLTLVNFEGTLTKRNTRAQKTFAFKGNPSYLKILQKGNVDAVSFANNHCRDYGEGSYQDTISVLKRIKCLMLLTVKFLFIKLRAKKSV